MTEFLSKEHVFQRKGALKMLDRNALLARFLNRIGFIWRDS
jgi:hypothetical protein